MTSIIKGQVRIRRKTSAQWQAENPVLAAGELGLDLTNKKLKVGDGVTAWNSLPFITLTDANAMENHNHDSLYAALNHNHNGVYSPVNHNHDSAYAALNHNHDGVYSPVNHNHDSAYAALNHNHNGVYSLINHNHDGVYQPVLTSSSNITVNSITTAFAVGSQDTSSSTTINWNTLYHNRSFNSNQTLTFSNAANGKSVTVIIYNSSASNITLTFPSGIKWSGSDYNVVKPSRYNVYTFIQVGDVIFGSHIIDFN